MLFKCSRVQPNTCMGNIFDTYGVTGFYEKTKLLECIKEGFLMTLFSSSRERVKTVKTLGPHISAHLLVKSSSILRFNPFCVDLAR